MRWAADISSGIEIKRGDIDMSIRRMTRQDNTSLTAGDMAESSHEPGVTVVIPCLNERITIAEAVVQAKTAFAHWPGGGRGCRG